MKRIIATVIFIFACVCLQAQTLSWDIKFQRGGKWESVPINRRIDMETGEVFLITIKPASPCHCYVVAYDSERNIDVLHNEALTGGQEVFIGPAEVEGSSGTDTLYVIMSLERQAKLETLIVSFNNNPGSMQFADDLRTEVMNLQTTAAGLGEPPHVFVPSGGSSRGSTEEFTNRYTEKDMYVRPIMIRH